MPLKSKWLLRYHHGARPCSLGNCLDPSSQLPLTLTLQAHPTVAKWEGLRGAREDLIAHLGPSPATAMVFGWGSGDQHSLSLVLTGTCL
jgi:hypothetical protein